MPVPVRVLMVEDSEDDALLMVREFVRNGYAPDHERVDDRASMMDALARKSWDVILSDYSMPHFSALQALDVLHRSGQDIPFIVVSGRIGEDLAVEVMRAGAHDFFPKSVLKRMPAAIDREIREAARRRERAVALQAERVSEARRAAILEASLDCLLIIDQDMRILELNASTEQTFGVSRHDLLGRNLIDTVIIPAAQRTLRKEIAELMAQHRGSPAGRRIEIRAVRADGTELPIEIAVTQIGVDGPATYAVCIRDITERREAEAALLRQSELLRAVVEGTTDAVFVKDTRGAYVMINSAGARFLGKPVDEVVGWTDWELMPYDSAEGVIKYDRHLMATGETETHEETIRPGGVTRTFLSTKGPYRNAAGEIVGVIGIARDVTERKREIEAAIESREQFISIAAHELKTPLTPLRLQVDSLTHVVKRSTSGELQSQLLGKLAVIDRQVTRLSTLVTNLLSPALIASNRLSIELEAMDLRAVVLDVAERLHSLALSFQTPLEVRAGAAVTGVWDRMRLDQVITNLLDNAIKYGAGRPVMVTVEAEGDQARLTVRDHGIGIAPERQPRIFERFERAVSAHQYGGVGLGLWIVRQIVDALQGTIHVKSRVGAGTTFTVILPRKLAVRTFVQGARREQ